MEQDGADWSSSTYGACRDAVSGIFASGGKEYPYYPLNGDTPNKIVTVSLRESGNFTFAPGSCQYGEYVGIAYSWIIIEEGDNKGKGNWQDAQSLVGVIGKPATGGSSVKQSSVNRGKQNRQAVKVEMPELRVSNNSKADAPFLKAVSNKFTAVEENKNTAVAL